MPKKNHHDLHHNSKDILASLEQNHSPSPTWSIEPSLPGNSNSFVELEKITSDLSIPIALRKGVSMSFTINYLVLIELYY